MPDPVELPEDMNEWPADPFRLLGVSRDMDVKTARKSYAQLIKLYKPERKPAEFQKIREAWEFVQKTLKARGKGTGIPSPAPEPSAETPEPTADRPSPVSKVERPAFLDDDEPTLRSRGPTAPPSRDKSAEGKKSKTSQASPAHKQSKTSKPLASDIEDDDLDLSQYAAALTADDFWDLAIESSDPQSAYNQLVRLTEQEDSDASQAQVWLQLYWLLLVYPELEGSKPGKSTESTPGDWLLAAWPTSTNQDEVDSRIVEQSLREIQRDGNFATSPALLEVISRWLDEKFCLEACKLRWQVCAADEDFSVIKRDLESLKATVGIDKERAWGQLVIAAIQIVVWKRQSDSAAEVYDWCRHQLSEISHLDLRTGHDYDRAEMLEEWADALTSHEPTNAEIQPWLEIVPESFLKPWPQTRILLSPLLEIAATETTTALRRLTELTQIHASLTIRLGELFLRYRSEDLLVTVRERPWEQAESVTREFLEANSGKRYRQVRDHVLSFCMEDCVDPRWIVPIARDYKFTDDWLEEFEDDLPILATYDAYRAYWG